MPELGHFALLSALVLSSCAIPADLVGRWRGSARLIRSGRDATIASCACVGIAVVALIIAMTGNDFEGAYAAWRTSTRSSSGYKSIAPWPGAAGSLLFWAWALNGKVSIAFGGRREDHIIFNANARVVANLVSVFFLLVLTLEINPFAIFASPPPSGAAFDLRLQNPLLLVGYAFCAVPLAWSFAWLKWDKASGADKLLKQVRFGILLSWFFLTIGTALGAWLVYRQVGSRGGWLGEVARDVSLMPWLPATALLLGSRIFKRDAVAAKWIVPLSLITFSSCILSAFLGRPEMPAGARKLFIILLIHIWVLMAISAWRKYRRSTQNDPTTQIK